MVTELGHFHEHSDVLGLDLWEKEERLRWLNTAARCYLLTLEKKSDARLAEAEAATVAEV